MRYKGKVIGLLLGLMAGVGIWGLLIGVILGHLYDSASAGGAFNFGHKQVNRQQQFFLTTFQVLGHLTKSKGRVTEADIELAQVIMRRMRIEGQSKLAAQQAFTEGKHPDFPLREKLRQLRGCCFGRYDLIRIFLEIQAQAALADGELHPNERKVLYIIAEELGVSRQQFDVFLRMMAGGEQFRQQQRGGHQNHYQSHNEPRSALQDACQLLGVSVNDEPVKIKRAYRKQMAIHHPDKLVAKGLPPQMMELAKQKAQNIQAAYDVIRQTKGF